jgi:hypothetical protein
LKEESGVESTIMSIDNMGFRLSFAERFAEREFCRFSISASLIEMVRSSWVK